MRHPEALYYPPSSQSNDVRHNYPRAYKANGSLAFAFFGTPCAVLRLSTILNAWFKAASSYTRYDPEVSGLCTLPDRLEIKWEATRWEERKALRGCRSSATLIRRATQPLSSTAESLYGTHMPLPFRC